MPKPCDIPALLSRIRQLSGNLESGSVPPAGVDCRQQLAARRQDVDLEAVVTDIIPVSYTHLCVYKRQV